MIARDDPETEAAPSRARSADLSVADVECGGEMERPWLDDPEIRPGAGQLGVSALLRPEPSGKFSGLELVVGSIGPRQVPDDRTGPEANQPEQGHDQPP